VNHVLYFLSVYHEKTDKVRDDPSEICSRYSGLILPSTFDEIRECMVEPESDDELVNLTLPSSHL
jgi:hypothetical protein